MRHALEHIRWYWLEYVVTGLVLAAVVAVAPRVMTMKPSGYVDNQQQSAYLAQSIPTPLPAQTTSITDPPITNPSTTPTPAATPIQPTSTVTVRVTVTGKAPITEAEDSGGSNG